MNPIAPAALWLPPALILLGAYLPVFPWCTAPYLLPKLLVISLGVALAKYGAGPKPLRPGFVAVVLATLVSALLSDSPVLSLTGRENSASHGLPGVLLIWLCYEVGNAADRGKALRWLGVGVAASTLVAVAQGCGLLPSPVETRACGLAGSPPFLGCMLALALPLVSKAGWAPLLAAIWFTHSRAGLIGAVAGLAVLYCPRRFILPAIGAAAVAAVCLLVRGKGDMMRLQIWQTSWAAFLVHPWFGWGLEGVTDAFMRLRPAEWVSHTYNVVDNGHNFVLSSLVFGGLVGTAALGHLSLLAARLPAPLALQAATVAVLAYGCFNPIPFTAFCVLAYLWGCE